jgi:hypothetical protein
MLISMDWARTGTLVVAEVMNNQHSEEDTEATGKTVASLFLRAFCLTGLKKGAIITRV